MLIQWQKLRQVHPGLWVVLGLIALLGCIMLYSAAGGVITPRILKQALRFGMGIGLMSVVIAQPLRLIYESSYISYSAGLILLIIVELMGFIGMGAQRWVDLYFIAIQPSEIMKITLSLGLARYFSQQTIEDLSALKRWLIPVLMVGAPVVLVLKQPDLGTAMMLLLSSVCIFFVAGLKWWKIILILISVGGSLPIIWHHLHTYQQDTDAA